MKKNVSTHNVWAKADKTHLHYKLYKAGKNWVSASLFMLSVGAFLFGGSGQARADTPANNNSAATNSKIVNNKGTTPVDSPSTDAKPSLNLNANDETQTDSYKFGVSVATYDLGNPIFGGSGFNPRNLDQVSTVYQWLAKYVADPANVSLYNPSETGNNQQPFANSTFGNDMKYNDGVPLYYSSSNTSINTHTHYAFTGGLGGYNQVGNFNKADFEAGYGAVLSSWYKQLNGYYSQVDSKANDNSLALANYTPYNPDDHDPAKNGLAGLVQWMTGMFGNAFNIGIDQLAQQFLGKTALTSDSSTKVIFNYASNSTLTDSAAKKAVDKAVNETTENINSFIRVCLKTSFLAKVPV